MPAPTQDNPAPSQPTPRKCTWCTPDTQVTCPECKGTGVIPPAPAEQPAKPVSAIHERRPNGQIAPGGSTGGNNSEAQKASDKVGAPSKYTEDMPDRLLAYFEKKTKEFWRREVKSESTGKNDFSKTEWQIIANDLPTMQGFAKQEKVTVTTLLEWCKATEEDGETLRYPDFAQAYACAQDMQQEMLVANGLNGLYNPKFAVFVAQNFTEMRDKQAIDHTSQGDKMPAPQVYLPEDLPDHAFTTPVPAEPTTGTPAPAPTTGGSGA